MLDTNDFIAWRNATFTKRGDGRVLRQYEKRLIKRLRTIWKKQEKYLLQAIKPLFVGEDSYKKNLIDIRIDVILEEMPGQEEAARAIVASMKLSMNRGGRSSVKKLELGQFGIKYSVDNLEAKKFLNRKLSHELSNYRGNINKTTTDKIRKIVQKSIDSGKSYAEVSELIMGQGKSGVFSAARGELIAITETGRAYGKGARIPIDDFRLTNPTRSVLKSWSTVGDDRVRESHLANEGDGEIPYEQFHSGTGEQFAPSGDMRCRCVEEYNIPPPT